MQNYKALFGGSFNPVHIGHMRLAIEVLEYMHLPHAVHSVDLIPCATPALKDPAGLLPFDLRFTMLKAACQSMGLGVIEQNGLQQHLAQVQSQEKPSPCAGITVSDIESRRAGASYTWHTLQDYKILYPKQKLLFVLGMENLCTLNSWYKGLELPLLADIGVMPRGGGQKKKFVETIRQFWPQAIFSEQANGPVAHIIYTVPNDGFCHALSTEHYANQKLQQGQSQGHIYYMSLPRMEISATAIRQRWLGGRNIDLLMPPSAQALLEMHADEARSIWKGEEHGNT